VLRLDAWALLPITLTINGEIIYKGLLQVATTKSTQKLKRGEGVTFVNGNPIEREREMNALLKHAECIFE
jgi:PDZ domain-containing secreted protein